MKINLKIPPNHSSSPILNPYKNNKMKNQNYKIAVHGRSLCPHRQPRPIMGFKISSLGLSFVQVGWGDVMFFVGKVSGGRTAHGWGDCPQRVGRSVPRLNYCATGAVTGDLCADFTVFGNIYLFLSLITKRRLKILMVSSLVQVYEDTYLSIK